MENNELIAKFMNLPRQDSSNGGGMYLYESPESGEYIPVDELRYHESWDWLMSVIEKIDNTTTLSSTEEPYLYCVSLEGSICKVLDAKTGFVFAIVDNKKTEWLQSTYDLVVRFIKNYKQEMHRLAAGIEIRDLDELDAFIGNDQPATCPKCGARTDFIDLEEGENPMQQHKCLGCGYEFFLYNEEDQS